MSLMQWPRKSARLRVCAVAAWAPICALLLSLALPAGAGAQDAQQRQAAANAFDRGTTAYLQEDFATAARWFEMANDLAPASGALMQAIIAHRRAGNELRAATLALRLIARFPDEAEMVGRAQSVIDDLGEQFFRIDVECNAECAVEVDGTLSSHDSFFLTPGEEHTIGATFDTGTETATVSGEAGDVRSLAFEAPEGAARLEDPADEGDEDGATGDGRNPLEGPMDDGRDEDGDESGGLSPAYFITALVLTAGAGATLAWSGVDTLNARDEYVETAMTDTDLARDMLEEGQSKELRTNILIGATAGLAAVTLVFAILTDWGGSDDEDDPDAVNATLRPQLNLGSKDRAGGLVLEGTF
jgi:hypothetical protein